MSHTENTQTATKSIEPEKQPRNLNPWSAVGITLLAYFGSQIMAIYVISLFFFATGRTSDNEFAVLTESTGGQFAFIFLVEAFTLSLLYWFMHYMNVSLKFIGLGRWLKLKDVGYAIAAFAVYFVALAMIMALIGQFVPSINLDQEQQIGFETASGFAQLSLVFLGLVILVPITEEIMIRGFLYSGLRMKLTRIVSALLASFIFGIAHLQLGSGAPPLYVAAIDTFFLSLVLIYLREKTSSLWSGIIVHALKNGLAFLALFVFRST